MDAIATIEIELFVRKKIAVSKATWITVHQVLVVQYSSLWSSFFASVVCRYPNIGDHITMPFDVLQYFFICLRGKSGKYCTRTIRDLFLQGKIFVATVVLSLRLQSALFFHLPCKKYSGPGTERIESACAGFCVAFFPSWSRWSETKDIKQQPAIIARETHASRYGNYDKITYGCQERSLFDIGLLSKLAPFETSKSPSVSLLRDSWILFY